MSATNLYEISSAPDFQEKLSQDLERVSVTNFWATWAVPCKEMNQVVEGLAAKYKTILFLQVDAEKLPEISESFEVESVPTCVVLKGHTLLGIVTGADGAALTNLVELHSRKTIKPTSTSDRAPAPPLTSLPTTGKENAQPMVQAEEHPSQKEETKEELEARMRKIMDSDKVVLFMKGSPDAPRCGFSRQTVAILREHNVKFTHFDILQDEAVRQGLKTYNNWPTYPQLIVQGELVGGLDIVKEMVASGEFQELVVTA